MTTSNTDSCNDACNNDDDGDYTDDNKGDDDTYDHKEDENSTKKAVQKNKMKSSIIAVEGGNDISHRNPPDPTNLQDHYTDAYCLAFHSRFFGKKCGAMRYASLGRSGI